MTTSPSNLPKLPQDQVLHLSSQGLDYILKNFDPQVPQRNFIWTSDYKVQIPVRVKKYGSGSQAPQTFPQMWQQTVSNYAQKCALNYQAKPNQWVTLNYKQYYDLSIYFAKALITLGITNFSAVNIIGFNSVQWAVAFTGSILGHYLPVGIYTTNGLQACQYIANHSQCQIVILEDRQQLAKYIKILKNLPKLKYLIIWKQSIPQNLPQEILSKILTWDELLKIGQTKYNPKQKQNTIEYRMQQQKPGNCCSFIYTSGTTGPPKAVMISHDNYTWIAKQSIKKHKFDVPQKLGSGRGISLLPLSHVAAQLIDLVIVPMVGGSLFFADPSALQGNLQKFLLISKPTFFMTVPRLWEKMQQKITALGSQTTGLKRKIVDWAKSIAPEGTYAEVNGGPYPFGWSIAKKLIFNNIKKNLGLDECQTFIFSAAPMRQSTRSFFMNLNFFLMNCFGMSELAGPATYTNAAKWKNFRDKEYLREAGKIIDGLTIAIDNPDNDGNGQICIRGRNTFMGYFKNEQQTRTTIDNKGFVHSGDIGKIDAQGNLTITGRIKQLLITAGGQNIAPVLIQNQINTVLPIFSSVVVLGDKRKYLAALLCFKLKSPQILADQVVDYISARGSKAKTVKQALVCQILRKIINQGIQVANEKAISKAQRVQKFTILPNEFSIDGGELTPTMKLKRKIINQKYKEYIESLYVQAKL